MESFEDFITFLKDRPTGVPKKYVAARMVANQINALMGFKDVNDDTRKGFAGIPADNSPKGIAGVILLREKKSDGTPFTEEEQKADSVILCGIEVESIYIKLPVADPCREVKCTDIKEMREAYYKATNHKWPMDNSDDPDNLEFGLIITNSEERVRYSVSYAILMKAINDAKEVTL